MRIELVIPALCLVLLLALPAGARTILRADKAASSVSNSLPDPGFEQDTTEWLAFDRGFIRDSEVRRSGKSSARCENLSADQMSGAFQQIRLDQERPGAIRAVAWSKAENVGPVWKNDYCLYLDIQFMDGEWLWGQVSSFDRDYHDWQKAELIIQPSKPIKQVNFHLLLRRCTGKVCFDDCLLEDYSRAEGLALLDGAPVRPYLPVNRMSAAGLRTLDGLELKLTAGGSLAGGAFGDNAILAGGGFYFRDVAAESDFHGLDAPKLEIVRPLKAGDGEILLSGAVESLGLEFSGKGTVFRDHVRWDCEITDLSGKDRAVTAGFALPLGAEDLTWWRSIRTGERVTPGSVYCEGAEIEAGATGWTSRYPFACVSKGSDSISLAVPMSEPCVHRIEYNTALGWYFTAFDLGLCPEQGVTSQRFSFLVYRSEGRDGMRAAVDKYYRLFPDYFVKRVEREGNWMAFRKVGSVDGWEDFGFAFHEGDNDIEWDAENGIYSFRYTEPMSHWMPMDKSLPRTNEQAFKMIEANLKSDDPALRDWASAVKTCLADDEFGKPRVFFFDAPWCDGSMFLMNCNPAIPKGDMPATRASISWNDEIAERLYGDKTKPQLAGEYLDSVEMGASYVNTRREHFRYASRPLTFTRRTKEPAILQILSTYEFARVMADDVRGRGKLMMANCVPNAYGFMSHLFDVLGTETNWLQGEKYSPMSDYDLDFRRTLCYQKPYCFLMNTDYETFDNSMVEKYLQRCMFWGMFPGFFSPDAATRLYFEQPKYYNRDRELFKTYIPVIKKIAEAGWQPLTMAETSDPRVEIERFGPGKDGVLFFTARNDSDEPVTAVLKIDRRLGRPQTAVKLPIGQTADAVDGGVQFALLPGEVAVIEIRF